jgi:hypothetical protein
MDCMKRLSPLIFLLMITSGEAFAWGRGNPPTLEAVRINFHSILTLLVFIVLLCLVNMLIWVGLSAFSMAGRILWPSRSALIEEILEKDLGKSLLLGLINFLGAFIILILLRGTGLAPLFLIAFMLFAAIVTLRGVPALFAFLGDRLLRTASRPSSPISSVLLGGLLLMALSLLPFLGLVMAKILMLAAFGGSLMSSFSYRKKGLAPALPPTMPEKDEHVAP